ncbi:MAG: hypothetical protein ACTHLP_14505 [Rhizobiaceae bacterium]|jgi:hypothetical protein
MLRATILVSVFGLSFAAAGCQSEYARNEGVTGMAGDAIAADTVLQMVDPWPRGVENTHLVVPADHAQYQNKSATPAAAPSPSGSNSSTDN